MQKIIRSRVKPASGTAIAPDGTASVVEPVSTSDALKEELTEEWPEIIDVLSDMPSAIRALHALSF